MSKGFDDDDDVGRSRRAWVCSQGLHHRPATTATMGAAEQRPWDEWLAASVHNAIYRNDLKWRKVIIHLIAGLRAEWQHEIDAITARLDGAQADAIRKAVRDLRHDIVMKARAAMERDDDDDGRAVPPRFAQHRWRHHRADAVVGDPKAKTK